MTRSILVILAILTISVAAAGQNSARVFDNFDRSQGVQVHLPPQPEPAPVTRRVKRNGRWVVITEDPLVKKTASTKPTASVADGFATRTGGYNPTGARLTMGTSTSLKGFTTGNQQHDQFIVESSRRYRIDPLLIYAQMHQESSFKIRATSHKGASGLMQLMPATARRFGVTKIYDPQQNIDAGVKYMRWLLDHFNQDVVLALAGYNAGEGAVMKYGWRIPPYRETQEYVRRITSRYGMISDGRYINAARQLNQNTAKVEQKESAPLTVLEVAPAAIRTADGKMMLVNQ
ncbi:MAG TPA: lytic transglycosylase domain-containing protein [Pyrinomonadaceae bacterium]